MKNSSFITRFVGAVYLFFIGWSLWEITERASGTGGVLGIFSIGWTYALAAYYLLALLLLIILIWLLISPASFLSFIQDDFENLLQKLGLMRWLLVLGIVSIPPVLFFGKWGEYFELPVFRQVIFYTAGLISGLMIPDRNRRVAERLVLGLFFTTFTYLLVINASSVADYPFSLSWSEGNRIWDYSLAFAKSRYILDSSFSVPTYFAPGRHGLWGLVFLIPDAGIRLVRLWDKIVWILPGLLLSWILFTNQTRNDKVLRWALVLWVFLFMWQGPIYSPLILSAMLLVGMYSPDNIKRSAVGAALACFYAGISRWTWFAAPAIWVVLMDLFYTDPVRNWNGIWLRVRRSLIAGGSGLLGGGAAWVLMQILVPREEAIYATALQQDLLPYRLWASATNEVGIVVGLLLAALPLLVLLILAFVKTKQKMDWLFTASLTAALVSETAVGLIASIKIGGGNNLHNLDMLLLTLILLAFLAYPTWKKLLPEKPLFQLLTFLVILSPVWFVSRSGSVRKFPSEARIQEVLSIVSQEIEQAAVEGDVLFIDQRQLLTFGDVPSVPLVEEYELKEMMNEAMRRNEPYFEGFYEDLESHRFSLIISDPLNTYYQGSTNIFGEENDLWVEQVSEPILQHYEPIQQLQREGIWLLAPIDSSDPE